MNPNLLEEIYGMVERIYNLNTDPKMEERLFDILSILEEAQQEAELNFNED